MHNVKKLQNSQYLIGNKVQTIGAGQKDDIFQMIVHKFDKFDKLNVVLTDLVPNWLRSGLHLKKMIRSFMKAEKIIALLTTPRNDLRRSLICSNRVDNPMLIRMMNMSMKFQHAEKQILNHWKFGYFFFYFVIL